MSSVRSGMEQHRPHYLFRHISVRSLLLVLLGVLVLGSQCRAQAVSDEYVKFGVTYGSSFGGDEITKGLDDYRVFPVGEAFFEFHVIERFSLRLSGLWGELGNSKSDLRATKYDELAFDAFSYQTEYHGAMIGPSYMFDPIFLGIQPSAYLRVGVIRKKTDYSIEDTEYRENWTPVLAYGFGVAADMPINDILALNFNYSANFPHTDRLDGFRLGYKDDGFSTFSVGLTVFLSGKREADKDLPELRPLAQAQVSQPQPPEPEPVPLLVEEEPQPEEPIVVEPEQPVEEPPTLVQESFEVREFESFSALKQEPGSMKIVNPAYGKGTTAPVEVDVRFMHNGKVVAVGKRDATLSPDDAVLNVEEMIDFENLTIEPEYQSVLPRGNYLVDIVVRNSKDAEAFDETMLFQVLRLDEIYGESAGKVRKLVDNGGLAPVFTSENELVLMAFAPQTDFIKETNSTSLEAIRRMKEQDAESEEDTLSLETKRDTVLAEAGSVLLARNNRQEDSTYLKMLVEEAFETGLFVRTLESDVVKTPSVVVSEVYFPFDETGLSEESKLILDQVAQELQKDDRLGLELRGYADDVGDQKYNVKLSNERAKAVREYLLQKKVPKQRLRTTGQGMIEYIRNPDGKWRQRSRKVEIILVSNTE